MAYISIILCSLCMRIAKSMRFGGPKKLKLERFTEVLRDESSGLTYPAITRQRK